MFLLIQIYYINLEVNWSGQNKTLLVDATIADATIVDALYWMY